MLLFLAQKHIIEHLVNPPSLVSLVNSPKNSPIFNLSPSFALNPFSHFTQCLKRNHLFLQFFDLIASFYILIEGLCCEMGDLSVGGCGVVEMQLRDSHSTSFSEPNRMEIRRETLPTAERAARQIIWKVQPTLVSEKRRNDVVEYMQRLIEDRLGAEVFPYGSVPLKAYLPNGDIDLTVFGGPNVKDTLADDIKSLLVEEEKNTATGFVVKDVQLIRAEVKLVKCIVQDIVVDVSINQLGGLCSLCFLEKVDRQIGRDHLFKQSLILIKAWCYYESRILGAHHGLISTYALETLVLYIFNHYHSALDGPLSVLYKFLDYFNKFDWDTYCVSLQGPILLSSLPTFSVEIPEDRDTNVLLSNDFLAGCVAEFVDPSRGIEKSPSDFQRKHLNIVDPLKVANNLGRSISKGNFYRIRSAFAYGARKLEHILLQPQDSFANELKQFFANTMARHGGEQRSAVQDFDKFLDMHERGPRLGWSGSVEDEGGVSIAVSPNDDAVAFNRDSNDMDAYQGRASRSELAESSNSSDLTGDYDIYLQHLQYGQWCYGMHSSSVSPSPCPPYPWDGLVPVLHHGFSRHNHHHNGYGPSPAMYDMQPPMLIPVVSYVWDDVRNHRGTGTYLPNTNIPMRAPPRSPLPSVQNTSFQEPNMLDRSSHEQSQGSEPELVGHAIGTSSRPQRTLSWTQRLQTAPSKEQKRISLRSSYRLKDEDDFPPLST